MEALVTLFVIILAVYLVRHFAPSHGDGFRLERHRPSSLSDWTASYYDEQRRYSDLVAVYGRGDVPDAEVLAEIAVRPAESEPRPEPAEVAKVAAPERITPKRATTCGGHDHWAEPAA